MKANNRHCVPCFNFSEAVARETRLQRKQEAAQETQHQQEENEAVFIITKAIRSVACKNRLVLQLQQIRETQRCQQQEAQCCQHEQEEAQHLRQQVDDIMRENALRQQGEQQEALAIPISKEAAVMFLIKSILDCSCGIPLR